MIHRSVTRISGLIAPTAVPCLIRGICADIASRCSPRPQSALLVIPFTLFRSLIPPRSMRASSDDGSRGWGAGDFGFLGLFVPIAMLSPVPSDDPIDTLTWELLFRSSHHFLNSSPRAGPFAVRERRRREKERRSPSLTSFSSTSTNRSFLSVAHEPA